MKLLSFFKEHIFVLKHQTSGSGEQFI